MRKALSKNNIQNEIKEDPVFQDSNTQTNKSLSLDSKSQTSFIKCPVQHTKLYNTDDTVTITKTFKTPMP